jgi:cell shape-determining protein MreC
MPSVKGLIFNLELLADSLISFTDTQAFNENLKTHLEELKQDRKEEGRDDLRLEELIII